MRWKLVAVMLVGFVTSCTITRVDTLEYCTIETESFANIRYWQYLNCISLNPEDERDNETKLEELINEVTE